MRKIIAIVLVSAGFLMAQNFDYVGVKKCKMCHNKDKIGAQYKIWSETAHANAFETLKSDKAAEVIKERGIKTNAWETPECVKCHTTGYNNGGYDIKDDAFWNPADDDKAGAKAVKLMKNLQSVTCEACHGPGSKYKSMKTMKALYAGDIKPEDVGLVIPDEKTCTGCHNEESPFYKAFNYDEFLAKIVHHIPEDYGK